MMTTTSTATALVMDIFPGAEIVDHDDTSFFDWALRYSTLGWRTVPLNNKSPQRFGKRWQHRASADPLRVRDNFQANWINGVGIMVPDDIAVVDIDPRNGGDVTWAEYVDEHGEPSTLKSVSGRNDGGCHYYFQRPQRSLRDLQGVDVKTSGQVSAPPTIHPATGDRYWWSQWPAPVAPMPDTLVTFLAKPSPPPSRESTNTTPGAPRGGADGPSVLDAFAVMPWSEIWPPGWQRAVDKNGNLIAGDIFGEPAELWLRKDGTTPYSARCGARWCYVFSTAVPGLPAGAYSKAQVFAWAHDITIAELARVTYRRMQEVRRAH